MTGEEVAETEEKEKEASTQEKPVTDTSAVTKESTPGESQAEVGGEEEEVSSKGKEFAIVKLRAERRRLREENQSLQEELSKLKTPTPTPKSNEGGVEDIVDGTQTPALDIRKAVREEISQSKLDEESGDALNYILSQDDITKQDLVEIGKVMQRFHLDEIAKKYPLDAAEQAVEKWRDLKKRKVDLKLKEEAKSLPGSSGAASGEKRVWSRKEIADMSDLEYEKNRDDILAAQREGRIK